MQSCRSQRMNKFSTYLFHYVFVLRGDFYSLLEDFRFCRIRKYSCNTLSLLITLMIAKKKAIQNKAVKQNWKRIFKYCIEHIINKRCNEVKYHFNRQACNKFSPKNKWMLSPLKELPFISYIGSIENCHQQNILLVPWS